MCETLGGNAVSLARQHGATNLTHGPVVDVNENGIADTADLQLISRLGCTFPVLVPQELRDGHHDLPPDEAIATNIGKCVPCMDVNEDTRRDIVDLALVNRRNERLASVVPSAWRDAHPGWPAYCGLAFVA